MNQINEQQQLEDEIHNHFQSSNDNQTPYEFLTVDLEKRWKDRKFTIVYYVLLILSLVISVVIIHLRSEYLTKMKNWTHIGSSLKKMLLWIPIISFVISGLMSLVALLLLRIYASNIIRFSFCCTFILEIVLFIYHVILYPQTCWMVAIIIVMTLIFFFCIRKRIAFSEAHLAIGTAAINAQPSVYVIVFAIFTVQFIWMLLWMTIIILNIISIIPSDGINQLTNLGGIKLSSLLIVISTSIFFLLTFSWNMMILDNIIHFIIVCTVGRWWFENERCQHLSIKKSIKRAFTTNFGTICLGSLTEPVYFVSRLIDPYECRRKKFWFLLCFVHVFEKTFGYFHRWALIYSALTGQNFMKASRNLIVLIKKRGWTMAASDGLIEYTMFMIIFIIMCVTTLITRWIFELIWGTNPDPRMDNYLLGSSAMLSILMIRLVTIIFSSSARSVFVCFVVNPTALNRTHHEHSQKLNGVWNKFYHKESPEIQGEVSDL